MTGPNWTGRKKSRACLEKLSRKEVHLVLPASMKRADLMRCVRDYAVFQPDYLLFTKLDETESHGALISTALRDAASHFRSCRRPKHSRRHRIRQRPAPYWQLPAPAGSSGGSFGGIDGVELT